MSTNIRGDATVEHCFAPAIHVLSRAVRQEKSSLLCLQELLPLNEVYSLHVDEVLNDDDGIREVQSSSFLNLKLPNYVLQSVEERLVHPFLVADSSNLGEEETRHGRQIESKLVWHRTVYVKLMLKNNPSPQSKFDVQKPVLLCLILAWTKHFPEGLDFFTKLANLLFESAGSQLRNPLQLLHLSH